MVLEVPMSWDNNGFSNTVITGLIFIKGCEEWVPWRRKIQCCKNVPSRRQKTFCQLCGLCCNYLGVSLGRNRKKKKQLQCSEVIKSSKLKWNSILRKWVFFFFYREIPYAILFMLRGNPRLTPIMQFIMSKYSLIAQITSLRRRKGSFSLAGVQWLMRGTRQ